MPQLTLEQLKAHLVIDTGETLDDVQIAAFGVSAEDHVAQYLRRDMDADFPSGWPAPVLQAVKMLVADFYHNRASTSDDGESLVQGRVRMLLAAYRNMG